VDPLRPYLEHRSDVGRNRLDLARFLAWYVINPKDVNQSLALWMTATQVPGMLDEFAGGLLLARFMRSEKGRSITDTLVGRQYLLLPLAVIVSLLFWWLFKTYWEYPMFWFFPWMVTFFRTPLSIAFALLLLIACCLNNDIWLRLTGPFRYLGTISYGIYLWHLPVVLSLKRIAGLSPESALVLTTVLSIVFAAISWHFFEKPIIGSYGGSRVKPGLPA